MRIKRLSWHNYKALNDGSISADGRDVIISGRNGSGKSTLAEMLPFVLFGRVTGTLKRYDEKGMTNRDRIPHGAEIEFEDGTQLRRVVTDSKTGGTTTAFYLNGAPVQKKQYDAAVEKMTHGAGEWALNPLKFFTLTVNERRHFTARIFGALSGREILSTTEKTQFAGMTAESFISKSRDEQRRLRLTASEIPARIEELELQRANAPKDLDTAVGKIAAELELKRSEQAKLQNVSNTAQTEYAAALRQINELERQEQFFIRQLERENVRREKLLAEYRRTKAASPDKCPTCGQSLPLEIFIAKRDEKLIEITAEGKACSAQIDGLKAELGTLRAELEKMRSKTASLKDSAEAEAAATKMRVDNLAKFNEEIRTLEAEKIRLQTFSAIGRRIEKLKEEERNLNERIVKVEGDLARAETYLHEKITRCEAAINANFEHVRFKLFERLTDGTLRETCEAMINGVPYSALSKGEKLKAALDIFKAIQRFYGVEMPLTVDDAESYTLNSFVELPNQKFLLKVTEGELAIEILEGRQAA